MRGAVFLDRDGVINHSPPPGEYIRSWDEFRFIEGIRDWIRLLNTVGLLVFVVTNQRGVSRGLMTAEAVEALHRKMVDELARQGARIDGVFCCMHEENTCDCRKPRPGLIVQAQAAWNIDLTRSIVIGDSDRDRDLAANCGLAFVRVLNGTIVETILPPKSECQRP